VAAPLGAGLAVAASVPPAGAWPAGLVGLAALYHLLGGQRARARFLTGFLAGLGLYGVTLWWATDFSLPGALALVVACSAYGGVAAALVPPRRWRPAAFASAVALLEALRGSWPFGGLPVGGVPLGQADGPLLEVARLGGWLAVTWAAGLAAAALAEALRAASARLSGRPAGGAWWAMAGAVAVTALAVGGAAAPDGGPPLASLKVAAVQGGGERGLRQVQVDPAVPFRAQLAASGRLRPPLDLVVWPEDVVALPGPLAGTPQAGQVAALARRLRATVVAGVTDDVGATRFRNRAVVWSPAGRVVASYDKVHRVPFGEYVPARWLFSHLANLSDVPRDAIAGHRPPVLATPVGPLAVMVSYEVFYSELGRAGVDGGGQLMVVPTNTSSYATGQVPAQELAAASMRAVEGGRDLVQASPTGYSALVDHRGRVLARTGLGDRQVLVGSLARRGGLTPFDVVGPWPALGGSGLALALAWGRSWRRWGQGPAWRRLRPACR
jgi:apolipoprotein N-acyltransferase